mgnify:CR=1 FL=1
MLISMTGFGRDEIQKECKQFSIEIRTVNNRYLDLYIKMPRSFNYLEGNIRQLVKKYITRGRVEICINYKNLGEGDTRVITDMSLANEYLSALDEIHSKLKIENDISVSTIANFPNVLQLEKRDEDNDLIWSLLKESLHDALMDLYEMRKAEGKKLEDDLLMRLETLKELIKNVEARTENIVVDYRERLLNRIKELVDDEIEIDENRLALEVALFADKSNITEEIVRFYSHIDQFKNTMKQKEAVGRKQDFIIQEMNREINTIGSKANDLLVSNIVVDIKSELEKMREQVQNIE